MKMYLFRVTVTNERNKELSYFVVAEDGVTASTLGLEVARKDLDQYDITLQSLQKQEFVAAIDPHLMKQLLEKK